MGVILDTSLLIALERGTIEFEQFIKGKEEEPFGLSVVTVAELLHGVYQANSEKRRLKRESYVEKIIEIFPIYPFDITTARVYARIWANLVKKGIKIGAHDLIIASTAISLGFSVATFNLRDYRKIEGLALTQLAGIKEEK